MPVLTCCQSRKETLHPRPFDDRSGREKRLRLLKIHNAEGFGAGQEAFDWQAIGENDFVPVEQQVEQANLPQTEIAFNTMPADKLFAGNQDLGIPEHLLRHGG